MFTPMNIEAMSLPSHNAQHNAPAGPASAPPGPNATAKLAHELSNLLDGSLRNIGLALMSLSDADAGTSPPAGAAERLTVARDALRRMARLIHRWMHENRNPASTFDDARTIGQSVASATALLQPIVDAAGIDLEVEVAVEAVSLPAGPLDPVLLNLLRNSVDAMSPRGGGSLQLSIGVQDQRLTVAVRDGGPGFDATMFDQRGEFRFGATARPGGHGLGLPLCREIVTHLGGVLRVGNRPEGGAVVEASVPIARLRSEPGG